MDRRFRMARVTRANEICETLWTAASLARRISSDNVAPTLPLLGTFGTCRPAPTMSVPRAGPEVAFRGRHVAFWTRNGHSVAAAGPDCLPLLTRGPVTRC